MSNGLKNIQSHARAYARRERLESGQPLTGYDDPDGALGCLTPVDDVDVADQSYSSPETGGSTGAHSTPGGSSGSGASAASHSHAAYMAAHHHHQQQQQQQHHQQHHQAAVAGAYQGYPGYGHHQAPHHGYSNSVSSTGTAGGYVTNPGGAAGGSGTGSQGTSPYLGHGNRLPSVGDMGIDAIINRGPGSQGGV